MDRKTYSTKEIADTAGIHTNTVRFYEQIGFLTPPARKKNGYRIYTELQLEQCRLIRLAMRAEVLQNGLRVQAIEIVKLSALRDFPGALTAAEKYRLMIDREITRAREAAEYTQFILSGKAPCAGEALTRKAAAEKLGVTPETLRTWERSGLVRITRGKNGYRFYSPDDMERLNIIRTLRCANYSLSSILRLFNRLEQSRAGNVEAILNTPGENEDIVSVCDRLEISLLNTAGDAEKLEEMLSEMSRKFQTLH